MNKDFDQWNMKKKRIHELGASMLYHARDVWWCNLGANIGFEQDGTGAGYARPVLILKGFNAFVCLVIPLTTSRKRAHITCRSV
ncbi:MAG: type II toxin-antitoxin system PemK/MazF family toxin [Patescibacteria group bacterium]|nr:type II toxin-antitoxin system PemK/MazF family toxin [Patescibacteria group bacterium]